MIRVEQCTFDDYEGINELFRKLINEIVIKTTGNPNLFNITDTLEIFKESLNNGMYSIYKAINQEQQMIGFISLCESFSLYANGRFGIIQELYVLEEYRSMRVGEVLISFVISLAKTNGWKRLEVCTPPLPEFERSFSFYLKQGFEVTGGKKMKILIDL